MRETKLTRLNVVERVENVVGKDVVVVMVRQRHPMHPRWAKRRIFCWREFRREPDGSLVVHDSRRPEEQPS